MRALWPSVTPPENCHLALPGAAAAEPRPRRRLAAGGAVAGAAGIPGTARLGAGVARDLCLAAATTQGHRHFHLDSFFWGGGSCNKQQRCSFRVTLPVARGCYRQNTHASTAHLPAPRGGLPAESEGVDRDVAPGPRGGIHDPDLGGAAAIGPYGEGRGLHALLAATRGPVHRQPIHQQLNVLLKVCERGHGGRRWRGHGGRR